MEFEAVEVRLEFSYLLVVGVHLLLGALPVLVDLLYDDLGVAVDEEPLDAEGGGDLETMDEGLVLSCVVSGLEE